MSHLHSVYDTDLHFQINPTNRVITNTSGKIILIQNDHNSERFTFEVPRYVETHDMSLCNRVEVHYINMGSRGSHQGVYEVEDLQVSPDANNIVCFSWLISQNATQLSGSLNFVIRFACLTGNIVDYAWSTAIHQGIVISNGINNSAEIVDEYADVLEEWENRLTSIYKDMTIKHLPSNLDERMVDDDDLFNGEQQYKYSVSGGVVSSPVPVTFPIGEPQTFDTPVALMYSTNRDYIIGDRIDIDVIDAPEGTIDVYVVTDHELGATPIALSMDDVIHQGTATLVPGSTSTVEIDISEESTGYLLVVFNASGITIGDLAVKEVIHRWAYLKYGEAIVYPVIDIDDRTLVYTEGTGPGKKLGVRGGLIHLKLTKSEYDALVTKDENTIYYVYDSNGKFKMYIGSDPLQEAAVEGLTAALMRGSVVEVHVGESEAIT